MLTQTSKIESNTPSRPGPVQRLDLPDRIGSTFVENMRNSVDVQKPTNRVNPPNIPPRLCRHYSEYYVKCHTYIMRISSAQMDGCSECRNPMVPAHCEAKRAGYNDN